MTRGDGDDADEGERTPLPAPLAHHIADPTRAVASIEPPEAIEAPTDADKHFLLNTVDDVDPGDDDLAGELETRQVAKLDTGQLEKIEPPPPTVPVELVDMPEAETLQDERLPPAPVDGVPHDTEDELTRPRDLPRGMQQRGPRSPLESTLFQALPADTRAEVLARFVRRTVAASVVVIRQGETGHGLIVVARGRLQVRVERASGQIVTLGYVRDAEFVGEGALLARVPSPIQVVATETSELLALGPREAYELAGAYPSVWAELKDSAERRTREWDVLLARR